MIEIERKFLVLSDDYKREAFKSTEITQGFLNSHKDRAVRVRVKDDKGFLTVKGESSKDGTTRFEWETEINKPDAEALLALCEEHIINKRRFEVIAGEHIFEIDEFFGVNQGLVVAEVELNDKHESFEIPEWLGKEVTGQVEYYNSQLSKHPYKQWKK